MLAIESCRPMVSSIAIGTKRNSFAPKVFHQFFKKMFYEYSDSMSADSLFITKKNCIERYFKAGSASNVIAAVEILGYLKVNQQSVFKQ